MLTVGVGVLSGAAIGASIAVLFPMLAAQTLLPALVGILGKRTLTRRQRAALGRGETGIPETSARWLAWAGRVQAHRIVFALGALGALGVLVALGVPFFSMRQGTADYSTDPTSTTTTTYRGYEMLVQGFGPGFSGPLQLVATVNGPADEAEFARVVSAAAHTSGVVTTAGPEVLPAGPGHPAIAVAEVYPAGSPQDASTSALITRLRDSVIPATVHGSNLDVLVGGQTALADDFASQLSTKLPLFVGMVVALSFLLLMIVFRSIAIPATAAIMNLFSAAAASGVIVAVFQWGWLVRDHHDRGLRIVRDHHRPHRQDDRPGHGRRDSHRRLAHPHGARPRHHAQHRQGQLVPACSPRPLSAPPEPRSRRTSRRTSRRDPARPFPRPRAGAVSRAAEVQCGPPPQRWPDHLALIESQRAFIISARRRAHVYPTNFPGTAGVPAHQNQRCHQPPVVARLDHVGLAVADLAAARSWFCDVFGLVPELSLRVDAVDLSIEMLVHPTLGYRLELLHRPGRGPVLVV
jgi:hypothetical protein